MSQSEIFITPELRPDVSLRERVEPIDIEDMIADAPQRGVAAATSMGNGGDSRIEEETGKEMSEPGPDPQTGKEASEPEPTGKEASETEPVEDPAEERGYPTERTALHDISRPIM